MINREEWNQIQLDVANLVIDKLNSRGNCMCETCKGRDLEEILDDIGLPKWVE